MSRPTEFNISGAHPWRGFTSIEAMDFLQTHVPGESHRWMAWSPEHALLKRLLVAGGPDHDAAGAWRWQRVSCPYPAIHYYMQTYREDQQRFWTGLVEVTAPDGQHFLVFSYLNAAGEIGLYYFVSTTDAELLASFSDALHRHFTPANRILVTVPLAEDLYIDADAEEHLCLPATMREDIERQALGFFRNEARYRDLGIPYRRGLLLVGPPGCGKTMTIRHLIRHIHRQCPVSCWALRTGGYLNDESLPNLFQQARRSERAIVVIEDIERIASTDSPLRPSLLSQMDGLASNHGLLVVATTNHPETLDPAVSKRPSRFDRTWVFAPPDRPLRQNYLRRAMGALGEDIVASAAERTSGWSFAYLNELRLTAATFAMNQDVPLGVEQVNEALDVLGRQFKSAKDGFKNDGTPSPVGFGGAP